MDFISRCGVKQIKRDLDAKALIAYRAADKTTNAFQFVQQMFGESAFMPKETKIEVPEAVEEIDDWC